MGYIAFVPNAQSRALMLQNFPPHFPDVVCHHVTLEFGVPRERLIAVQEKFEDSFFEVKGIVTDHEKIEALLVTVSCNHVRSDGGFYHITHSLDRSKGAKPVHSNQLVMDKSRWNLMPGYIYLVGNIEYFD